MNSIDQILGEIKKQNSRYSSNIWIPSLKRDVKFVDINTSQQKRIIKSILDSTIYEIEFATTLRDILKENCIEDINIDDLTVIDQVYIAITLRASCVGVMVPTEVKVSDTEKVNVDINLEDVLKLAKDTILTIDSKTFSDKVFEVVCGVPSISTAISVQKDLQSVVPKELNADSENEIKALFGDAFVHEIVKYIKSITILESEVKIPWNDLSNPDKIKIVETINIKTLKQILDYAEYVRQEANKIELVNFKYGEKVYSKRLSIDADFFIGS